MVQVANESANNVAPQRLPRNLLYPDEGGKIIDPSFPPHGGELIGQRTGTSGAQSALDSVRLVPEKVAGERAA